MTQWIETSKTLQNGEPVTRAIEIEPMDREIFFTDSAYAEVSGEVADLLANNISSISKVSEPDSPGSYFGDAGENVKVQVVASDNTFEDLTVIGNASAESVDAEEATIGATPPDSVRPSPLILRGGDSGQGIILQNKDDSQDTGAGRANITWYSDSEEYLAALTSHPSHNHFSIYTRNGPLGSSANLEKRMDIGGGSDLVTVKYKNLAEWRLNNGRLNVIDRMNPPVYATADDLPADADSQEADVAWVNDEERWYTYVA